MLGEVLPRHLEILFAINKRFLEDVQQKWPGDIDRMKRMSLVEEDGEKRVNMAFLSIVGSTQLMAWQHFIRKSLKKDCKIFFTIIT